MTTETYPCVWEIGYRDFDGSAAWAGCSDPAGVLLYDPNEPAENGGPTVFSFCTFHATVEPIGDEVERVLISDLVMTCTSCGRPVWAAHADDHVVGRPHPETGICQDREPDHAPCACPHEAAYEAAMLVAQHAEDRA